MSNILVLQKERITVKRKLHYDPPVPAPVLNRKERIYNKAEATLRKPAPIFDLNQKARTFSRKEATLQGSAPIFDMNQKERIYSGKDATKRHITLVFDLNQILTDDKLLQKRANEIEKREMVLLDQQVEIKRSRTLLWLYWAFVVVVSCSFFL
ncbi:uncharacterized protein LOC121238421 [Juglans microcarpa x Juglans regia]|uniref:uncharacterized protein LOC121238421 n=1 Tax=Juglans microcarpa x Juglans regia TaxID=2249226 RepID=UPI001B7EBE6F|nr:uncharacterized protein LOC121238421 [Juglans microcarpa x Juglans regia]